MSKGFDKLLDHFEKLVKESTEKIDEIGKKEKYPYPHRIGGYGAFGYTDADSSDYGSSGGDGGGIGEDMNTAFYIEPETTADMKAALYLLKKHETPHKQAGDYIEFSSQEAAKDAMDKMRVVGVNSVLVDQLNDSAPEGWEGTVKAMKKHKDIDNPYALANYMKKKGHKSHYDEAHHESVEEARAGDHQKGKPKGLKSTRTMELLGQLRKSPMVDDFVEMHSTGKGTVALVRTDDGDAYEVEVTPSHSGNYFQRQRGVEEESDKVGAGGIQATMKDKPKDYLGGQKLVGGS